MNCCDGMHVLDEMERARLWGGYEYDAVVRKDTFPIELCRKAVCQDKKKIVLDQRNGNVVVCERR